MPNAFHVPGEHEPTEGSVPAATPPVAVLVAMGVPGLADVTVFQNGAELILYCATIVDNVLQADNRVANAVLAQMEIEAKALRAGAPARVTHPN